MRERVFKEIERSYDDHLEMLKEFIRQPSVSLTGQGIREMAVLLSERLKAVGFRDVELIETRGNPVVFGKLEFGAPVSIATYTMYDVMPAEEPGWDFPPFQGSVVRKEPFGEVIVGRGACNSKGQMAAFIGACEATLRAEGKLPVNVIFFAEGEEEIGSTHLENFIEAKLGELKKVRAVFSPEAAQDSRGKVQMHLGCKGDIGLELEISGEGWGRGPKDHDIHSQFGPIVDNPAWRMAHALSTMTAADSSRILIERFYDDLAPPSDEDEELLRRLVRSFDEDSFRREWGISSFAGGLKGYELLKRLLFSPVININGVISGYTGPGCKTVLPHKITVKVDVRLVPNMTPEGVVSKIRAHLDRHGFHEVVVRRLEHGLAPYKLSFSSPAAQAVLASYRELGHEPEVWPLHPGSAPSSILASWLNVPVIDGGLGHGANYHAPNEYLVVGEDGPTGGLISMEKSYAVILENLAKYLLAA